MVTVCIFALRDVIRKVQSEFETPFNSTTHTSPSTAADIQIICDYLHEQKIQSYLPIRPGNDQALPARDLIACGSEYANKLSAFRNFKYSRVDAINCGVPEATAVPVEEDFDVEGDHDMGFNGHESMLSHEDLELDDDEFPLGSDINTYLEIAHELVDELSYLEVCFFSYFFCCFSKSAIVVTSNFMDG